MICRDCGKEFFDEEHPRRLLCDDCRLENIRKSKSVTSKKFFLKILNSPVRHEQRKEHQRAWRRERYRRMTPDDKRRILLNKKIRKAVANDEHKPFCQWCGRDFKPKYKGEKYCSEECYSHSPLRRLYKENHRALKFLIDIFFKDGRLT